MITTFARKKLVEHNMRWKEAYTDKTIFLKEQFEAIIGPGSYFRFEGKDLDDGDDGDGEIVGLEFNNKSRGKHGSGDSEWFRVPLSMDEALYVMWRAHCDNSGVHINHNRTTESLKKHLGYFCMFR